MPVLEDLSFELKTAIVMFVIGFGLSFFLGLFSGIFFLTVLFRALISGVILGGISFAAYKVISFYAPEVIDEISPDEEISEGSESVSGENFDIVDESLPVEEVISTSSTETELPKVSTEEFTDLSDTTRVVVENSNENDVASSNNNSFSSPSSTSASDFLMSGNSFSQMSVLSGGKSRIMGNSVIVEGKEIPNQPEIMAKAIRHVLKESD